MNDPSGNIISTETQDLLEARIAELRKVLKLKLILNEVRAIKNIGKEQTPEIKRALKLVSVADFIRLGDGTEHLLGLQDCTSCPSLSYTDRKALRSKLTSNLSAKLTQIVELGDRIRCELPDAMSTNNGADAQLTTGQQEIIKLQKDQRECLEKLVEKRREKCELMLMAADLKMGPHFAYELKVQQAQAELWHTKSDLMRMYCIHNIFSRTDHSLRAHKEVDKYVDELLSANQNHTKEVANRR
ncbi:augmin complex subunit dgt2 [Drosophila sulfurigaster albostrigata]|uniref:augmin complex subunit dgt2 n=1 Tax=Drosophila sulfurigaster albostrigata TaxID=89887 RepID=UPI002D21A1FF|nr:augmin complex subunit dgt2 [Drosophila sulfurigaster albostrigata]